MLTLNPQHQLAWNLIGQLFMETAQTAQALKAFRRAVAINPRNSTNYYHMGLVYELMEAPSSSVFYYQKAVELRCTSRGEMIHRPYNPQMRVALGEGYFACGEVEKAMECYLVAESLGEEEGLSSRRLGKLYAEQGREVEAAYYSRRCLVKKNFVICDNDSYEPAVALCQYYKKTGNKERLQEIGSMLLAANDEVRIGRERNA